MFVNTLPILDVLLQVITIDMVSNTLVALTCQPDWVHYTSSIASYEALQKGSFKKPWSRLNVQSHVFYFANRMCRICLFCRLHPLHHQSHSGPCPPNSLSSSFLLCFILAPLPPSHFWWVFNCSFFFFHDFVHLFVHHEEFCDCCRCVTTVPYLYGLHGTVVSVHVVYSTVRTMVGVSLPYCLHVLLQYTPHGTVVSVHLAVYSTQVLFVLPSRWWFRLQHHLHVLQYTPHRTIILVPQTSDYLYRIVCIYTLVHVACCCYSSLSRCARCTVLYHLYHAGTTIQR